MRSKYSILCGAIGFILGSANAQAGDLPSRVQSAPDSNLPAACAWTGEPDFYLMPGTDTCVHVGGYVRSQYSIQSTGNAFGTSGKLGSAFGSTIQGAAGKAAAIIAPPAASTVNYWNRNQQRLGQLARGEPIFETRTPTSMGTLRVLMQLQFDSGWGSLTPLANPQLVDKVFVQWAGITAGRAESFFKFYDNLTNTTYIGLRAIVSSNELFGYTVQLGNGFQAGVSAENPENRRGGILQAAGTGPGLAIVTANVATPATALAFRSPDFVGQIKVDQSWGSAQVSAAYHQTGASWGTGSFSAANVNGFAALAGVNLNLPFLAPKDFLLLQGTYANGAVSYLGAGTALNNPGASFLRSDSDFFLNTANGRTQTERGYNLIGNFRHYWTPVFWQAIYASYTGLTPGSNARTVDWTVGGISKYNELRVSSQWVWLPVKSFSIGAEAMYEVTRNKLAGAGAFAAPVGYKKDYNSFIARVRLNRIF